MVLHFNNINFCKGLIKWKNFYLQYFKKNNLMLKMRLIPLEII